MAGRNEGTKARGRPRGYTRTLAFEDSRAEQTNARLGPKTAPTVRNAAGGGGVQLTKLGKERINLTTVSEALCEEGLDPAVEIARVLKKDGALDDRTRTMVLLELLQYRQPKLKAVEQTIKIETTPEQDARRLSQLLQKAGIAGGTVPAAGAEEPQS